MIMQSRGVLDRVRTQNLFAPEERREIYVVCHTEAQAANLESVGFRGDRIYVHGLPEGVTAIGAIRDWMEKKLLFNGEWYIGIDDNISRVLSVQPHLYDLEDMPEEHANREDYGFECRGPVILDKCMELVQRCEDVGTTYGGFAWMENPGFRRSKWQYHGYAKAKLYVRRYEDQKKSSWCWDPRIQVMFDHALTFKMIAERGCVVINRYVYCEHPQYEAGGIGSHAERLPFRKPTQDFLYEYFEGLVAPWREDYDKPALCRRGQNSIDKWRKAHGFIE